MRILKQSICQMDNLSQGHRRGNLDPGPVARDPLIEALRGRLRCDYMNQRYLQGGQEYASERLGKNFNLGRSARSTNQPTEKAPGERVDAEYAETSEWRPGPSLGTQVPDSRS